MDLFIQRSMLIIPSNAPRFIEKAHTRGADAILLDLEDAVPAPGKEEARKTLGQAVNQCGASGAKVLVRVNNDPSMIPEDISAAMISQLHGIFLPKVEQADQVRDLDSMLATMESEKNLAPESVKVSLHIESPLGLLNLREIAGASSRIESLSLGVDDYCLELGVEPSGQGHELFYPFSFMVTIAGSKGIRPFGILGSVSDYKNMEDFEVAATKAKQLGSVGGYCIHPSQVAVLNRVFSPTPQEIRWAEKIIAAFEEALEQGRAATGLEGKMLDPPIYKRAKRLVAYSGEIERLRRGEA